MIPVKRRLPRLTEARHMAANKAGNTAGILIGYTRRVRDGHILRSSGASHACLNP